MAQGTENGNMSPSSQQSEGQNEIWNAIFAFSVPLALKAALHLQIPNILSQADSQGLTLDEIAENLPSKNPNKDYLFRIMRFLVCHRIFSQTQHQKEVKYGLTRSSRWLVTENNPSSLAPFALLELNEVLFSLWHRLADSVLENANPFELAHGVPAFDYLSQNPSFSKLFNEGMVAGSKVIVQDVLEHYHGFKDVKVLADVGGGFGQFISKIVEAYPHIRGINFDLPHVVAFAPQHPGVEHVGGDMFRSVPGTDAIIMKWILHDWDDQRCRELLRNCHMALPVHGKVIIVEIMLQTHHQNVGFDMALDLQMICNGGKERTKEEWISLLTSAGFPRINILKIPSHVGVIEAFKS